MRRKRSPRAKTTSRRGMMVLRIGHLSAALQGTEDGLHMV